MQEQKWIPIPERREQKWVPVRRTQIKFYVDLPLYKKTGRGKFVLYKPPGTTLEGMPVSIGRIPEVLYIRKADKIKGIQKVQKRFNQQLEKDIESKELRKVKDTLTNVVEETLAEPRSGSLQVIPETIDILVAEYAEQASVIRNLASLSFKDYTTVIHSINVMALVIGFCFYIGYSSEDARLFGLSALLHDIGKTEIPTEILTAPRKLSDEEFQQIKAHTSTGYEILKDEFDDENISLGALEHHEKLDGSGYPRGIIDISLNGQLIGVIDSYEALTNDDRPYRNAMTPFRALELIKKDVKEGKYSKEIFEKFVYSLGSQK